MIQYNLIIIFTLLVRSSTTVIILAREQPNNKIKNSKFGNSENCFLLKAKKVGMQKHQYMTSYPNYIDTPSYINHSSILKYHKKIQKEYGGTIPTPTQKTNL